MTRESRQITYLILFRVSRSLAAGMIALTLPYLILTALKYGPLKLGVLYTTGALASAGLGLGFGFLADTWGRKKTLFLVGVLLPVSSLLVFLSGRFHVLLLASALGGYSATGSLAGGGVGGAAQPIQSAVLSDLVEPGRRTRYFSLLTFLSGLFAALGALLARYVEIHETFLLATLIAAGGIVFLIPLRPARMRANLRRLRSKLTIGKFTLTGILNGLSQGMVMPYLIPFFVLAYHVPKPSMAAYAFASGGLAALALLAAPRLERRLGFVRSVAATRGLGAGLLLLLPLTHFLPAALAIYVLTPSLRVAAVPVQQAALSEMVAVDELGRAWGINQVARLTASSAGISLSGYLFEMDVLPLPFFLYGLVVAVNLYLYFRFFSANPVDERWRES
jgi:MFS family permease